MKCQDCNNEMAKFAMDHHEEAANGYHLNRCCNCTDIELGKFYREQTRKRKEQNESRRS